MIAPTTQINNWTGLEAEEFSTPVVAKEVQAGIIRFQHEIRIDTEFLELVSVTPAAGFEALETDFFPLDGADKESMYELKVTFDNGGPMPLTAEQVLYTINLTALKVGNTTMKFLNDLPKFPQCDCFYFGEDGIEMDQEVFVNGQIAIQ